jgi:hypothetical protein
VVERLPSNYEALSSNPVVQQTNQKPKGGMDVRQNEGGSDAQYKIENESMYVD